jgi:hypothetical protein
MSTWEKHIRQSHCLYILRRILIIHMKERDHPRENGDLHHIKSFGVCVYINKYV